MRGTPKRYDIKNRAAKREAAKRFNGQVAKTKGANQMPRTIMRGGTRF